MPSTRPSWAAIRLWVRSSSGISDRQGGHHDAHRFRTTTLPWWSASEPVPSPPSSRSSLMGASTRSPLEIDSSIEVSGPVETTPYESSATSAVAAKVTGQ